MGISCIHYIKKKNISDLQIDPIDWYSQEETLIESQTMDVILLSIEWLQKPFTLLPMHSVYHKFEYHIKNSTNALDIVTDVVTLDPTIVSDEIPDVNNYLIINDDNIGEDEGCSAPIQVGVNNVSSDGLKKDQHFQIESPEIGKDTRNSPVQSYEYV